MISYTWNFPTLTCYPEKAGETDVVFTIHWRLMGTDENNNSAEVYGTVGSEWEEGTSFTPFNELTKEQVQAWVEAGLGEDQVASLKETVARQIKEKITPSQVNLSPPWATPPQPTPEPTPEVTPELP
jgi:hypothetical protein